MQLHCCSNCAMSELCLPVGLGQADLSELENIITASAPKHAGDKIVRQGDQFTGLFAVKSGMCKSYRFDADGVEYIQNFHLPGEIFGLEAIYSKRYGFTVEALNTLVLCEFNFHDLQDLCTKLPALQQQMFNLFSRELYTSQVSPIEHFDQTAEQKLAGFLHDLLSRLQARGHVGLSMNLPMPRRDIANHLGLTAETISRVFKKLQNRGIININNRFVNISNLDKLEDLVHCHALESSVKSIRVRS